MKNRRFLGFGLIKIYLIGSIVPVFKKSLKNSLHPTPQLFPPPANKLSGTDTEMLPSPPPPVLHHSSHGSENPLPHSSSSSFFFYTRYNIVIFLSTTGFPPTCLPYHPPPPPQIKYDTAPPELGISTSFCATLLRSKP